MSSYFDAVVHAKLSLKGRARGPQSSRCRYAFLFTTARLDTVHRFTRMTIVEHSWSLQTGDITR